MPEPTIVQFIDRRIDEDAARDAVHFSNRDPDGVVSVFIPTRQWELDGRPRAYTHYMHPHQED